LVAAAALLPARALARGAAARSVVAPGARLAGHPAVAAVGGIGTKVDARVGAAGKPLGALDRDAASTPVAFQARRALRDAFSGRSVAAQALSRVALMDALPGCRIASGAGAAFRHALAAPSIAAMARSRECGALRGAAALAVAGLAGGALRGAAALAVAGLASLAIALRNAAPRLRIAGLAGGAPRDAAARRPVALLASLAIALRNAAPRLRVARRAGAAPRDAGTGRSIALLAALPLAGRIAPVGGLGLPPPREG
jgi:hypothetical protein